MSTNIEQLQRTLPRLAGECEEQIRIAVAKLRAALVDPANQGTDELARGWRRGIHAAIDVLRPAEEASKRFRTWAQSVTDQEPSCGLSAEERRQLLEIQPRA